MRTPYRLVGIMAEPNQQLGRPDKIGKYDRRCFGVDHRARVSAEHDTQFCNSLPILSRIARRLTSRNARRGRAATRGSWLVYEGADIGKFGHTLPLAKAMDDVSWPTARMATLAC